MVRIGVVGDYAAGNETHVATNGAIAHAGGEAVWIATDAVGDGAHLRDYDGVLIAPGSPYRSMEGALTAIRYARTHDVPLLGTCGGFQHLVIEFARNVCGIADAEHAESSPAAANLFITPLSCSLAGKEMDLRVLPDTRAHAAYRAGEATERYYCNFGLNPERLDELTAAGLRVSGVDADGEVRIVELSEHHFFVGTLFVPQASSAAHRPHPLLVALVEAARFAANRANWNDRTPIHLRSRFYDVDGWLADGRGPREEEVDALGDVTGLTLVHPQCHFGLDTLQWARAGAIVTGIDLSPAAVEAARDLATRAGLADRSRFLCANVYDAATAVDNETFDIVYVSAGALCWLPSVDRWAEQVAALLKPGGRLYLCDIHPLTWALAHDQPRLLFTFFEEPEPYEDTDAVTYTDGDHLLEHGRNYQWNHAIGETVTALRRRGLCLDELTEHDWIPEQCFPWLVETAPGHWTTKPGMARMALTYTVLASKPTHA